jgi:Tfp pilus assembly protein PilF
MIYDSQGNFKMSDSLYEKALEIDSANALIANNYAYSLSERGVKLEKALELAKFAVEKEPENSSYLDTKGWILFKLDRAKEAVDYVRRALLKDKNNAEVLEHMGKIYLKLGEVKKGNDFLDKAKKERALAEKKKRGTQ